ncbi:unnamed protein product [Linum trigynum]|uniref:Integrator complex subunit 4/Protein SIEL C-terminal Ig-like domain-containing protein n=1 Tax=Linum trigynum TaxID=586398 RepID=A0AAV2DYM7_9ROSI
MEQQVRSVCELSLDAEKPLCLQFMASMRSLIVNPHTSNSTISSTLEILIRSLQHAGDSPLRHHALKLLYDIASLRPSLSPAVFDGLRSSFYSSLSAGSSTFASEILAKLASLSDKHGNPEIELDDRIFVSLCFLPSVTGRLQLLTNAERLGIGASVLFTVFFGLTKDPYPYVRKAALDGLAGLSRCNEFEDVGLIEGCFRRAVELLRDAEDCVRSAAVRVVIDWGTMLFAAHKEKDTMGNVVFIQLCCVVRDMSVEVRVEAFKALGKVTESMVSEEILLQSLSKITGALEKKIAQAKSSEGKKENRSQAQLTSRVLQMFASNGAGAFLHGLEDEFHEVVKSACCSLRKLVRLSAEFAGQTSNLLINMLNDHTVAVRLEALETLHYMAGHGFVNVQKEQMHMFLGTLADKSDIIRYAARRTFRLVKLSEVDCFRSSVSSLLKNLEVHPQDEADTFSVLFHLGRNHGNFASQVINDVCDQLEPVFEGTLSLDSANTAAYLVLSISAPLSKDHRGKHIPPHLYSFAVTHIGRISLGLGDIMDQTTLLTYLTEKSISASSVAEFIPEEHPRSPVVHDIPSQDDKKSNTTSLQLVPCESSGNIAATIVSYNQNDDTNILKCLNLILGRVRDIWLFGKSSCNSEALRTLSACKEEVSMYRPNSPESSGACAFTLQYVQVVKILAKVSGHIFYFRHSHQIGELEVLLSKLDYRLREIRSRFIGFSKEEDLQILELVLFSCLLKLATGNVSCWGTTLTTRLLATISQVESLRQEGSMEPSSFVAQVKQTLNQAGILSTAPLFFKKLADNFSLGQFTLRSKITHVSAELVIPGYDSHHPLPFVPGLPVAIPVDITLHNISSEGRLWLSLTSDDGQLTQFLFLDPNLQVVSVGAKMKKKISMSAPFYGPPKASSFSLRVCLAMECTSEDVLLAKGRGGPKHPLVYLCQEKEVYLQRVERK